MANVMLPNVILVDDADRILGTENKLSAHRNGGKLHRAFSVFITNSAGEMLLQRRSRAKYHFAGLWTNACCSHPRPGEDLITAAAQRLGDEFGFTTSLRELFSFIYRAEDPASGLTEHEFDHVLHGRFDGVPRPNADEIEDWKWVPPDRLLHEISESPLLYTPWFRSSLGRVLEAIAQLR
jgi:isopentenyl-diphosphate delta-isomerase